MQNAGIRNIQEIRILEILEILVFQDNKLFPAQWSKSSKHRVYIASNTYTGSRGKRYTIIDVTQLDLNSAITCVRNKIGH